MKRLLVTAFLLLPSLALFAGNHAASLEEAKTMAAEKNKPILVDVYMPN